MEQNPTTMDETEATLPASRSDVHANAITPEQFSDGHLAVGPTPSFLRVPRWATVADVPQTPLPPVPVYECRRVTSRPRISGALDKVEWGGARWSEPFGRISDGVRTGHQTRVAFLWNDVCLYVAFDITDPDIRAMATVHHDQLYMTDDVAELFVDAGSGYYEVGVNAINTVYEYRWTWLDPIVERQDWSQLEALFKIPDFLYYTARGGDDLGRVGDMGFDLPGLQHAVQVSGALNQPDHLDVGWTAELAIPWVGLAACGGAAGSFPPEPGDTIRIQAYRAQHDWSDHEGRDQLAHSWPGATPFEGHAWSPMGNGNIHNPERWASVQFVEGVA